MKKIIILGIVFLFVINLVTALSYNPDQTLRLFGQYTESGIYTESDANITIFLPNNVIDVQTEMITISTGKFIYDYIIPNITGKYKSEITFYNNSDILGFVTEYFEVNEDKGIFEFNSTTFYFIIGLIIFLFIISFATKQALFGLIAGLLMLIMSLYLISTLMIVGVILTIVSILIILLFLFNL